MHSTTFDRIVELSFAEQQLLNQTEWSAADHARCIEIQAELARLWPKRRAEQVFQQHGPPRFLGGGSEYDQKRAIAHGIAPLTMPTGGD